MMNQPARASYFRQLHLDRPLVLPNAWDAGSARIIESAGAKVIATTSAGIAWSLGRPDGQKIRRDEMLQAIRYIVQVVNVPVTVDIESGYGTGSPGDVADTVRALVAAGVAGINLEDAPGAGGALLMPAEANAERIRAARAAAREGGGDLVINARTDVYLVQFGLPDARFEAAVKRARMYRDAGADCTFVPGVVDDSIIAELVTIIDGPLNIMAGPDSPTIQRLGELGVARVSTGPALAQAALGATREAARDLLERGSYDGLERGLSFSEANGMFPDPTRGKGALA